MSNGVDPQPAPAAGSDRACAWRIAFGVLVAAVVVLIVATHGDYGISNDEQVQHLYGEKLLSFYLSGFADRSAFAYDNLYLYGGLFDLIAAALVRVLPLSVEDTRHLLSAVFGVFGIVGAWRLGRLVAGPRAGFVAAFLLTVTGAWYGAMFNHTKDVPFAVMMLWAVYGLCRVIFELPRPRASTVLMFGAFAGLSLGLRVGALLLGLYTAVAVAGWIILSRRLEPPSPGLRAGLGLAARLLPGAVLAYVIMVVFWPWAVFDPLNPIRALTAFEAFRFQFNTILDGQFYPMYDVPRIYVPVYLAIKLPLLALVGLTLVLGFGFAAALRRLMHPLGDDDHRHLATAVTAFAAVFPIVYIFVSDPPTYDGIRHFLFVVPPLCVLAGIGIDRGFAALQGYGRWPVRAAAAACAGWAAVHVGTLIALHPHQYLHYNALVGGLEGAQRRYVMDYWGNTVPEATEALVAYLRQRLGDGPIHRTFTVAVCAPRWAFDAVAPPFLRFVPDPEWQKADFFIATTHMNCDRYLPGEVVNEVRRLGAVVAVVKDRRRLFTRRQVLP